MKDFCLENLTLDDFNKVARVAAGEGAVLLKNEGEVLPLKKGDKVSVFGRVQKEYYRSGTGSGGAVVVAYKTNLIDELLNHSDIDVNRKLAKTYEEWIAENPFDNGGGGWAAEPWFQKDMPLTEDIVKEARTVSEKALYVIGRTAGEDKDNGNEAGSYLLTKEERENLEAITAQFEQVVVVLNVSNIMDMKFTNEVKNSEHIKGIIYVWQGGMEGGRAAADVLCGDVSPSGKLPDTIAYSYEDYPSANDHGGEERNVYTEDIYVGYRYFETFAPDKVMYEFGFGLSYTDFTYEVTEAKIEGDTLRVSVQVTNTGDTYNGKEVIQLYYQAPQGQLGRPVKELGAFAKTGLLAPGERDVVELEMPLARMAAYDDGGYTGHKSCYVLEEGNYEFYVGNSVRNTTKVLLEGGDYSLSETKVIAQYEEILAPTDDFKVLKPGTKKADGTYERTYVDVSKESISLKERIQERLPKDIPMTEDRGYKLQDVKAGKVSMEDFIAQFSVEDMAALSRGEGMGHPDVTPGTAAAFGAVTDRLAHFGLPLACAADGPSGIRMEGGDAAVQLPIGTLLAASWNIPLMEAMYVLEGKELNKNKVDTLLGPGLNLHRNPLNGRNFEYFSEDPYLTGAFATAIVKGIAIGGSHATIKHFACNSQEYKRTRVDAVVSERAAREMYLKAFEMVVRDGYVRSIMTSYNPINGHWAASNYDLNTTALRKEWGYQGMVMTDWWALMNDVVEKGEASVKNTRDMLRAQNDVFMVVTNYGAELNVREDNTEESVANGRLTVGELQRSAMTICRFLMNIQAFDRVGKEVKEIPFIPANKVSENAVEAVMNEHISIGMNSEMEIEIKEDGVYCLYASIMSPDSNIFQNAANIYFNDVPAAMMQTQGTDGNWIAQRLQKVRLEKGSYKVKTVRIKSRMEIEWFMLKRLAD